MLRGLIAAGLIAAAAAGASAHHSFAAFDTSSEKTISGTVKQFDWTNPHTWIWIDVANAQGSVDTYGFEGMSPNYLARRGWTKTTVKPGDKISVTYRPMRDGSHGGMFMTGKLSTGEVLSMSGLQIAQ